MEFDYYRAAFRKKGGHALLDDEAVPFRAIKNNLRYWVADPFVFERDGETYIFAELFDYLRRRGVIGYSKLKANGSFSSWKEIIVEPYHMSYPQIFEHDGEIYIVPETMHPARATGLGNAETNIKSSNSTALTII